MSQNAKLILVGIGVLIAGLAIIDMLDIPVEFPTKNNTANLIVGIAVAATPFIAKTI